MNYANMIEEKNLKVAFSNSVASTSSLTSILTENLHNRNAMLHPHRHLYVLYGSLG